MKARGLPGKDSGLSRRLRLVNAWGCFRNPQLMSLAGADSSHGGRTGGKTRTDPEARTRTPKAQLHPGSN